MTDLQPPTSGLTDTQLKLSYFFVSNKILFRKILIVILVIINCGFWGYVFTGLAFWVLDYQRLSQQTDNLLFSSSAVLPAIEATKPQPLNISEIQSFGGDNNRFDLMAQVVNPNANWLAEFDYTFTSQSSSTAYPGFVLPAGRKILLALGQDEAAASLAITNIKWTKIIDFASLKDSRDRFLVKDASFFPASKLGNPSHIKFTLVNQSAYSYWEAGVVVFLYSGGNLVSLNYLTIPQFRSGSSREIELNWSRALANIDNYEIIPEINYLDPQNIIPSSL